jgi:hypothetical protein
MKLRVHDLLEGVADNDQGYWSKVVLCELKNEQVDSAEIFNLILQERNWEMPKALPLTVGGNFWYLLCSFALSFCAQVVANSSHDPDTPFIMADSAKYEVLSRCLQAASGAVPGDLDGNLLLVHVQNDGSSHILTESQMKGGTVVDEDMIGEGVKAKSPVAYLYANSEEVCESSL